MLYVFKLDQEDRSNPRGIVPIWRARYITEYKTELLPPLPVPLPVKESLDSLLDIIDYLQQQYKEERFMDEGEGEAELEGTLLQRKEELQ